MTRTRDVCGAAVRASAPDGTVTSARRLLPQLELEKCYASARYGVDVAGIASILRCCFLVC